MDRSWIVAASIAAAALAGALVLWPRPAPTPVITIGGPVMHDEEVAGEPIVVHVSGAVARPGLVSLPAGARVADAIVAAGGASPDAALAFVNLALPVVGGQQLVIPRQVEGTGGEATPGAGPVHLNRADAAELVGLPGVGPVLAARIVAHRDRHGPFQTVEDLLDVPGIGEAKLAALRDHVVAP